MMKPKLIAHLSKYLLGKLHWRLLKDVVIEALNALPVTRRDIVLREIVAKTGGVHVHRNPTKRAA